MGPNGSLYGDLEGGIQNCGSDGSQYCGLVFNLTPQPTACRTSLCSWNENVPYRFSSDNDGSRHASMFQRPTSKATYTA